MTTQMIIRVDQGLKNKVSQLAKAEGKNLSELVRELLERYTMERNMSAYIDNLWERIGNNLSEADVSEVDISEAIKQVRWRNA
ncbi:MAG: ribbon-helix-helix protein, CopG family [Candidatus Sabulitectum sp.]|nr:ribbon-helix-helix protein, CopG family [Candidatus Sabulitectum sp.]